MPEITSAEAVRAKLREFELTLDGAINSARTIARAKDDSERLLSEVTATLRKSQESLLNAEAVEAQLQGLGGGGSD